MSDMPKDGCTPEVSWEVCWPSVYAEGGTTRVVRRDQLTATVLARTMRENRRETKLVRVERTEVDF